MSTNTATLGDFVIFREGNTLRIDRVNTNGYVEVTIDLDHQEIQVNIMPDIGNDSVDTAHAHFDQLQTLG